MNRSSTFLLLLSFTLCASGQVAVDTRPFAIDPDTSFMSPDGVFDITRDDQLIGVFLRNTSGVPYTNVVVTIDLPPASGITVTTDTATFPVLLPNIPTLAVFRGSFASSFPGKQDAIFDITADGFADQVSRAIFVARRTSVGSVDAATVSEGTVSLDVSSLQLLGGADFNSALFPTSFTWTFVPSSPFADQFSPLPFSDPWWKIVGVVLIGAGTGLAIGDGIDKICQGDPTGPAQTGAGAVALGGAILTVGKLTTATDIKGPFRKGEENTLPSPGSITTSEEVTLNITYLDEPAPGVDFEAQVDLNFSRFLSDGGVLNFSNTEVITNDRVITGKSVSTNGTAFGEGDELIITAQLQDEGGASLSGTDAFVIAKFGGKDGVGIIDSDSVILRDDGQNGDAVGLDGIYTGVHVVEAEDVGIADIFLFAQDVNLAPETGDPLILAQEIGGILLSVPETRPSSPEFCTYQPDSTVALLVCDVDGDGVIDIGDISNIFAGRNTTASLGDARDADQDGQVTVNDARLCVLVCDNPRCAP